MATRLYFPASAAAVPGYAPAVDAAWEISTGLVRSICRPTPQTDAMATASFADSNATNRDIAFYQFISDPLTAGQTVTGSQAVKAQLRCSQVALTNNLFLTIGVRVIAANGTTVQKTVVTVTRDTVNEAPTALTNRAWTATSAATNYTTVAGDRLVIEIGMAGDPDAGSDHDSSIRFGDAAASDLPEDDTDTTDLRPWIQFTDSWLFTVQELLIRPLNLLHQAVPTLGAALLAATLMPNLLTTTLAPSQSPSSQTDWPLPGRGAPQTLSWIQTRPVFAVDEVPAHQTDWPNPAPRAGLLTWHDTLPDNSTSNDLPFVGLPFTLSPPTPRYPGERDLTTNLLPSLLSVAPPPIVTTIDTLPALARASALTWLQTRQPYHVDQPTAFAPAWPNPAVRPPPALTWIVSNLLETTLGTLVPPPPSGDWPLPLRVKTTAITWLQTRPVFAVDQPTAFAADWPNPKPRPTPAQTWIVDHLLRTTIASLVPPPASGDWPLPRRAVSPALSWLQTRPQFYVDAPTAFRAHWPTPARLTRPTEGWTQNLLETTLSLSPQPFRASDWPNPSGPRPARVDWFSSSLAREPGRPDLSPLPPARRQAALTWLVEPVLQTTLAGAPVASGDWPLPVRPRPAPLTWLQVRPQFYQDGPTAFVPEWPNPQPRPAPALTWIVEHLLRTTIASIPTIAALQVTAETCVGPAIANEAAVGPSVSGEACVGPSLSSEASQ